MGISDKLQVEGGLEPPEPHKWVIAGISLRAPLRPINTTNSSTSAFPPSSTTSSSDKRNQQVADQEDEEETYRSRSTTPTAKEARIPDTLPCPPAPRKRRPSASSTCRFGSGGRDHFFVVPPDLESVFVRRVERAK